MDEVPNEFSVLTLNCWGLKWLSKLRKERLLEIGRQIAVVEPCPAIVALQELWTQEDYRAIRRETRCILPYGKFYFSGQLGGGLAILSKWPIEESSMFRYPLNGRPTAFFRGDWFVGKGVACARIRYGSGLKQVVEVFNTHTHAPYSQGPGDTYLCHGLAQAWEIAKLIRGAAERGHLVLAMGDFNMIPSSMAYRIITSHAPVHDAFRVLHPDSAVGPATHPAERARGRPVPSAAFNLRENGAASDGPFCTWRWPRDAQQRLLAGKPVPPVDPDQPDPRGKRLDYVFAGCGDIDALGGGWVVRRAEVGMTMSHPELRVSLSDHFAVEATLAFHPLKGPDDGSATVSNAEKMPNSATWPASIDSAQDSPNALQLPRHGSTDMNSTKSTGQDAEMRKGIFLQSPAPSSPAQRDSFSAEYPAAADRPSSSPEQQLACFASPRQDTHYMPPAAYAEVLAEIHWYQARERAQERWRGRHFLAWAVVAVVCHVAVWWSPHNGVAFVLMLLSTLGFVAGTVDGLLSLLFFRWELRTLREFEWEIRNAMAVAGGELKAIRALQDESGQDSY